MTVSTNTDTVRSFCDTLARNVLTDAVTNFKSESNEHILSDKVRTMNGTIVTNHVNHLDNYKKLQENDLITSENAKNSSKNSRNLATSSTSKHENEKLVTIQEAQDTNVSNGHESSGDDLSSLTSDTDSNSDGSLSDSTEEEVEFFPAKKSSKQKNIQSEQLGETIESQNNDTKTKASTSENIPSSSTTGAQNMNDIISTKSNHINGGIADENTEQNNPNTESSNGHKLPRKLNPLDIPRHRNRQTQSGNDSLLSNRGLQLIPTTSNDKQLTSGNSEVVIPSAHEPPDLIKGNLNSSGTVSDDSDVKDHARILAELQKIVQEDDGSQRQEDGGTAGDNEEGTSESVVNNSTHSLAGKSDGISDRGETSSGKNHGTLNGDHNIEDGMVPSDGTKSGFRSDNQDDNHGTLKSHLNNSGVKIEASTHFDGTKKETYHQAKKLGHDGTKNGYLDKNGTNHHGNNPDGINGDGNMLHGHSSSTISNHDEKKKLKFHDGELDAGGNTTTPQQSPTNRIYNKPGSTKTHETASSSPRTTPNSSNTNLQESTNQPANLPNQDHSLENLERKLSNLQISNTEQTAEIRRLNTLNQSLKTKFEKLEQASSYHQTIEEKMLQRNEELEKHLLGMLKSQEIIFDMKENLKVASADKEKLTKDYKEAVKALEAVDKLFGQKDALVKKWKEATEESRNLVELLKKHNAEVGDLEAVDKLKEEITVLKAKVSKAEERNTTVDIRNDEVVQQSKNWKEKYERENEQAIKLNFQLQEVTKELKNHQKLAGKRGRKNQMLQLEITELKDTLKLAKEKLVENERRLKEMERKHAHTQEMYTKIIHEKEKQHSVLINNSESYQKELVSNIENAEHVRKEAESLKENIVALEKEKIEVAEKLRNNEKSLEETLTQKAELSTELAKLQSDFEASKVEAVDNELFSEEQAVRLQEMEDQCRQLQAALRQYLHGSGTRNRRPSTAPNRYRRSRPSQAWPTHPSLDMYRELLSPPRGMPSRRKSSAKREARYRVQITDKNDLEDNLNDMTQKYEDSKRISVHQNRPKSTYGNRSLSTNDEDHHHDREHNSKDWVPKIVLVDSQKLESGSEHDSGSVSADQYAMQYVKLGDKVLFELAVDGKKQNVPGIVKYVGPVYHTNFKSGIYAGLKMDIPAGDTSGTVGNREYFRCLKKHGKFVKLSHILAVQNPRTQQYTRVLPMTYK